MLCYGNSNLYFLCVYSNLWIYWCYLHFLQKFPKYLTYWIFTKGLHDEILFCFFLKFISTLPLCPTSQEILPKLKILDKKWNNFEIVLMITGRFLAIHVLIHRNISNITHINCFEREIWWLWAFMESRWCKKGNFTLDQAQTKMNPTLYLESMAILLENISKLHFWCPLWPFEKVAYPCYTTDDTFKP